MAYQIEINNETTIEVEANNTPNKLDYTADDLKSDIINALQYGGYTYDTMYELPESVSELTKGANSNGYSGVYEITADLHEIFVEHYATPSGAARIGTWIDGNPILRKYFEIDITPNNECNIIIDIGIKSMSEFRVLQMFASSYKTPIDGLGITNRTEYCKLIDTGISVVFENGSDNKLYGFIEFVTPLTNVK